MTPQRFQKLPVEIDAYQWFEVSEYVEGVKRDVDYYRHPPIDPVTGEISAADHAMSIGCLAHSDSQLPERMRRDTCNARMDDHGYIDTLEGGHTVCPGDWIITGVQGEKYPCKPDIFDATYRPVERARGIDLEIYEPVADPDKLAHIQQLGVIAPRRIRLNGQEVIWPNDQPPIIHEMKVGDPEPAMVSLTLFARSIKVHAHQGTRVTANPLDNPVEPRRSGAAAVLNATAAIDAAIEHAKNLQAAVNDIRTFTDGKHTVGAVEIRKLLESHHV